MQTKTNAHRLPVLWARWVNRGHRKQSQHGRNCALGLVGQEWLFGAFASNGVKPEAEKDIYIKIVKPSTKPAP